MINWDEDDGVVVAGAVCCLAACGKGASGAGVIGVLLEPVLGMVLSDGGLGFLGICVHKVASALVLWFDAACWEDGRASVFVCHAVASIIVICYDAWGGCSGHIGRVCGRV